MSDTQSGVNVNAINATGHRDVQNHPNASTIRVEDGHLVVTKDSGGGFSTTVAVYAPEKWTSATVLGE